MRITFRNLDITIQKDCFKGILTEEEKRTLVDGLWFRGVNTDFTSDLWDKLWQSLDNNNACRILIREPEEIAFFINEAF